MLIQWLLSGQEYFCGNEGVTQLLFSIIESIISKPKDIANSYEILWPIMALMNSRFLDFLVVCLSKYPSLLKSDNLPGGAKLIVQMLKM